MDGKIAIATFGERVSPRFDCAPTFTLVTAHDGQVAKDQQLTTSDWAPHERINKLVELGVDTVICGGIDWWSAESLRSAGIRICCQVTGEIDDALAALVRGDLAAEPVAGSGPDRQGRSAGYGDRQDGERLSRQRSRRGSGCGHGRRGRRGGGSRN